MFRKKFLNVVISILFMLVVIIFVVLELIELPFALITAFIIDKWPRFAWFITKKLIHISPAELKLHEWPLKIN